MNLVIVESPAKCSKIKSFLGANYKVIASMGHIRALVNDLDAVGIERDFEPKFAFLKDKSKAISQIKESMKGCTQVYLAADDDREGEAIAYSVCILLGLDPLVTPRAVFHEITKTAVVDAVSNPRRLDMNKVHAQQARAVLDMLIGYTLSPLLWKHVTYGLSAGRCQTPALRLITDKERTVTSFESALSWKVGGTWVDVDSNNFSATLDDELEDEDSASAYLEIVRDSKEQYTVKDINVKPWKSSAPPALITSTLQQQASALFGMSPKNCMQTAQHLYEEGYITYMRTDSAVLSEEAANAGRNWIKDTYGSEFVAGIVAKTTTKKTKSKKDSVQEGTKAQGTKAQEAHEAIRPTDMTLRALPEGHKLSPYEEKLYGLIWRRALQSLMSDAHGETKTVKFSESPDFPWTAQWKRTLFQGWKQLGNIATIDEAEDIDGSTQAESWNETISVGQQVMRKEINGKAVQTSAPTRYTEASLVRELEKKGIGRPSTYASIIGTLSDKNYIEIKNIVGNELILGRLSLVGDKITKKEEKVKQGGEKKKMVPTELGIQALQFLEKEFADLIDYSFTAQMEDSLDKIALGEDNWKNILRTTWSSYSTRYYHFLNMKIDNCDKKTMKTSIESSKVKQLGEYKAVMSKKGPLLLKEDATKTEFYGWPDKALAFSDITEEIALPYILGEQKRKVEVGNSSIIRTIGDYVFKNGPYGPYMYNASLKTKVFIKATGANVDIMTESDAAKWYKDGIQKKKASAGFRKQFTKK